jgi:hypothetical protein
VKLCFWLGFNWWLFGFIISSLRSSIVHVLVTMFLVPVLVLFYYSVLKHCAHIRCTHIVCTYSIRSAHVYYVRPCTRHYVPRTCTVFVYVVLKHSCSVLSSLRSSSVLSSLYTRIRCTHYSYMFLVCTIVTTCLCSRAEALVWRRRDVCGPKGPKCA